MARKKFFSISDIAYDELEFAKKQKERHDAISSRPKTAGQIKVLKSYGLTHEEIQSLSYDEMQSVFRQKKKELGKKLYEFM